MALLSGLLIALSSCLARSAPPAVGPSLEVASAPAPLTGARGYLTTPQELRTIGQRAAQGVEPYATNVGAFLGQRTLDEPDGWIGSASIDAAPNCYDGSERDKRGRKIPRGPDYLIEGSRLAYAKLLAAHLSDAARGSAYARDASERILVLADTRDWGGDDLSADNQCVLYLSWYVPSFIMAADLLETFPAAWTASNKQEFQRWLANEVYPKVAWSSRARTNNWGSSGSYAAAMIADYLHDSGLMLQERLPRALRLTPGQAYAAHTAEQLSRMSTVVAQRDKADSRCLPLKGIQPGGGIPDELRRAEVSGANALCAASFLERIDGDYRASYTYQMIHIEPLIAHAELALRRGDPSLYTNVAADGSGSILQAIKFLIANPARPDASYNWDESRRAQLFVAYRYYRDPALLRQLVRPSELVRAGEIITYGQLTHAFSGDERLGPPPVPAPPGAFVGREH